MTHNQEQYVDIEISKTFIESMQKFQRVIQIQFESAVREVFITSVEQCKEQIRFAMKEVQASTGKHLLDPHILAVGPSAEGQSDPACKIEKSDILKMSRDAVM